MTPNLKALGLALAAVLALGAVAAPAASATDHVFTSSVEETDLTGESVEPALEAAGITATCANGTYSATVEGEEVGEVRLHPEYDSPCELSAGLGKATVRTNGCDYVLTGETHEIVEEETVEGEHATVYLECEEPEESIEIEALNGGIVLHIGEQGPLVGAHYDNIEQSGHEEVTVTATVGGVTYSCTGGFCGLLEGGGSGTDGFYEDDVTVTGYEAGEPHDEEHHVDIGVSPGEIPAPPKFYSEESKTTLIAEDTGSEEMAFKAGSAVCEEAGYRGQMPFITQATLTIEPEFASCEAFGYASAEVLFNGCAYVLHRGESAESAEGSLDIECPAEEAIEVLARNRGLLKCRVTIGAQSGLTTITETNKGTGASRDIALDLGLTGVAYTQETGEGLGKCEAGSFEDGEVLGEPTMIGENEAKEQVGIWAE